MLALTALLASTTDGTPQGPQRAGRYRWYIVRMLFGVAVVLYLDRINISIAAPTLASEFGLTPAQLGRVLSAFLFGYAAGLLPGGYLADRLGPHRLIFGAVLSWALVTAATGLVPGGSPHAVAYLIGARFLLGLCEACALPAFNRAFANWMLLSERAKASGWVHCGAGVGGSLTPLLVAALIGHFGWRFAFLASAVLTGVVAFWWWWRAADRPAEHPLVEAAERSLIAAEGETDRAAPPDSRWLRRAARSKNVYILCASLFCFGVAQFVYITWFYTYFAKVRGESEISAAILASLPYVAISVGSPVGGWLCDAAQRRFGAPWGRRAVPLVSLGAAGLCAFVAPAIADNVVSALFFTAAAGLQYAAASAYWSTAIDLSRRGTGLLGGFMNGSTYLGSALATGALPLLAESFGWTQSIQYAGLAAVVAALLWLGVNSGAPLEPAVPEPKSR